MVEFIILFIPLAAVVVYFAIMFISLRKQLLKSVKPHRPNDDIDVYYDDNIFDKLIKLTNLPQNPSVNKKYKDIKDLVRNFLLIIVSLFLFYFLYFLVR